MSGIRQILVRDLSGLVFPISQKTRLMIMLRAYFDESGTDRNSQAVGVAAYISSAKKWDRFQKEWDRCLDRFGIEFFHMTDWVMAEAQFKGWSLDTRHELFGELVRIIRRTIMCGVSSFTIKKDFIGHSGYKEISPYTYCVFQCLFSIEKWADRVGHHDLIGYVFESGSGFGDEILKMEKYLQDDEEKRKRFRLGSISFVCKKRLNPLQAADILVYEQYKEMINFVVPGKEEHKVRESVKMLMGGHESKYECTYFDKRSFDRSLTPEQWVTLLEMHHPRILSR